MRITIINGPNLNLLGKREPEVYGKTGFEEYLAALKKRYPGAELSYFQSNVEGEIVDMLQKTDGKADGIVLNAASYTHTSVAIGDAVAAISTPVVEVHISNVYKREVFRHHSYVSPHAAGVIAGCGLEGYALAIAFYLR